uniref:Uncharacterized protein n=1 Tax=Mesocestoides corti TaxID=53468 RepID=A0A5K3FGB8_MESCO
MVNDHASSTDRIYTSDMYFNIELVGLLSTLPHTSSLVMRMMLVQCGAFAIHPPITFEHSK